MSGIVGAPEALCRLAELHLVTLEDLEMLKSSSASRVQRQRRVCDEAVSYCRTLAGIEVAKQMKCVRLVARLEVK